MFYLLDFKNHKFHTCNSIEDVANEIDFCTHIGVHMDEIEIINCFSSDDMRYTVEEFQQIFIK